MIRAVPELVAFPYPIGYDVINYYIPVITNLEEHWPVVSGHLPIYTLVLHSLHLATGLSPHLLVSSSGIILYGLFSVSLFLTSRRLLRLSSIYSTYLALFVILQLPVLRTSWDLHKDILALTLLLTSVSLIPLRVKIGTRSIIGSCVAASIAVSVDKMVGILFVASVVAYAFVVRVRNISFLSLVITMLFSIAVVSQYGNIQQSLQYSITNLELNQSNPTSKISNSISTLFALFLVVNGPLLIPGVYGFIRSDNGFLKIATTFAAVGSFSWLLFPDRQSLVADRWIFLFGIFLSIFAGYGVLEYLRQNVSPRRRKQILFILLGTCALLGISYEVMPHQFTGIWRDIVGQNIEPYGPSTMQFNSIAIRNTINLTSMISWINENTPVDALFIGEKHWRGWMELELEDERDFMYYSSQDSALELIEGCEPDSCYLIARTSNSLGLLNEDIRIKEVYQNKLFKVYNIRNLT
jgi:hypothetical protein